MKDDLAAEKALVAKWKEDYNKLVIDHQESDSPTDDDDFILTTDKKVEIITKQIMEMLLLDMENGTHQSISFSTTHLK